MAEVYLDVVFCPVSWSGLLGLLVDLDSIEVIKRSQGEIGGL